MFFFLNSLFGSNSGSVDIAHNLNEAELKLLFNQGYKIVTALIRVQIKQFEV